MNDDPKSNSSNSESEREENSSSQEEDFKISIKDKVKIWDEEILGKYIYFDKICPYCNTNKFKLYLKKNLLY